MEYNRETVKGNLLKQVVTRIDYHDVFGLSPETKKLIGLLCAEVGLLEQKYRVLDESDMVTNDMVTSVSIPYEYLKDVKSLIFSDKDNSFQLEVNQLFMKVTQIVDDQYRRYHETIKLLKPCLDALIKTEKNINIKRVGIKKSNEVVFKEVQSFLKYFNPEVLPFNLNFGMDIRWEGAQSTLINNFTVKDVFVNFVRILDNGEINGIKCLRLYLEFEPYLKNITDFSTDKIILDLERINTLVFEIFRNSLTKEALDVLVKNERLGDFNE